MTRLLKDTFLQTTFRAFERIQTGAESWVAYAAAPVRLNFSGGIQLVMGGLFTPKPSSTETTHFAHTISVRNNGFLHIIIEFIKKAWNFSQHLNYSYFSTDLPVHQKCMLRLAGGVASLAKPKCNRTQKPNHFGDCPALADFRCKLLISSCDQILLASLIMLYKFVHQA